MNWIKKLLTDLHENKKLKIRYKSEFDFQEYLKNYIEEREKYRNGQNLDTFEINPLVETYLETPDLTGPTEEDYANFNWTKDNNKDK